ncbi:MAG: hypothetical protein KA717_20075 [Woronichinia naegeliana WA131]|uniref:Transposase IS204/IS1001/IS1096/IS1165 helix-turn-helix domain-containing protein n=1 Tax=Woronichinia naegeliana WA131 TaxID=2824559 RepID=A0A977KRP9_9CYAN|nr:MAG: hypothetical protein KA717_20075 [Woronichinia naegeliana WA131]
MRLRKHYTIRYEEKIYEQVKKKNVEEVRQEEEISWGTLESIFEEYAKQAEKKEWELPEKISLDEFSNRKGKKDWLYRTYEVKLDYKTSIKFMGSLCYNCCNPFSEMVLKHNIKFWIFSKSILLPFSYHCILIKLTYAF